MGHLAGIHYGSVPLMAGVGLLLLLLAGYRIRSLPARAVLSLAGHLRPRPDPWLEGALRDAFAEFDRELSAILHGTGSPVRPAGPAQPARRVNRGSASGLPRSPAPAA